MKKYLYITLFAVIFLSSGLTTALAADNPCNASTGNGNLGYCPLEPIPGLTLGTTNADVPTFLKGLFRILFSLAALLAVARLVIGGIMYMTSDVAGSKSQAKKWAMSSLYGLLILAGSYLILNTINPDLIKLNLTVPTTGRSVSSNTSSNSTTGASGAGSTGSAASAITTACPSKDPTTPADSTNSGGGVNLTVTTGLRAYPADSACGKQVTAALPAGKVLQNTPGGKAVLVINPDSHIENYQDFINQFQDKCWTMGGKMQPLSSSSVDEPTYVCLKI